MSAESVALASYTPPAAVLREPDELFETAADAANPLAELFAEHQRARAEIEEVSAYATGALGRVYDYFCTGNARDGNRQLYSAVASRLFRAEGAIKALDAACWKRALDLTDVLQHMTAERRNKWHETIERLETPPFTPASVAETLRELLAKRLDLLAERVDGIFRRLSGEHVTNRPQGFGPRMILRWVHSGGSIGYHERGDVASISDLRCVVAKFMGRDEPAHWTTRGIVEIAIQRYGEWIDVDGGALRLRVYKKGTGHLEVHPEMAWRLNAILAHRYPRAIAAEARTRPPKPAKEWPVIERPLPTAVLDALTHLRRSYRDAGGTRWELRYASPGPARDEAVLVLEGLGARVDREAVTFPYDATAVIETLIARGTLPDQVTHQYYPTPPALADLVIELAGPITGLVLEPSAGQGALADRLRAAGADVTCIELSPLHAEVLRAKGHQVVCTDFLGWRGGGRYAMVVMNPPFSEGRWQAHLRHASMMVADGGRLVAVLPESARRSVDLGREWAVRWSAPIDGAFPGVSVSVVVMTADRAAAAEVAA